MSSGTATRWKRRASGKRNRLRQFLTGTALLYLAEGVLLLTGAAWLFYRSLIAAAVLSPLSIFYCRYRIGQKELARQKLLAEQFRDALESINNALRAGDSPENAFREGYKEMVYEFGENSPICRELVRVVNGLDNRIPLETLLEDFAARAGTEEIREFAEVFRIAKRGGGNMVEILARTSVLIEERLDVENEIRIMLGNRKLEQRIMDITPFMIIFYIGVTSPGFFDVLYHNPEGAAFMTVCLGAYLAALVISEKILEIRL
jgi:tight adherence protein B